MLFEGQAGRFLQRVVGPIVASFTGNQALRVAQTDGEGDDMTRAGLRFHMSCTGATGQAPVQAIPSTTAQWFIYNPIGNPVTAFLDVVGMIDLVRNDGVRAVRLCLHLSPQLRAFHDRHGLPREREDHERQPSVVEGEQSSRHVQRDAPERRRRQLGSHRLRCREGRRRRRAPRRFRASGAARRSREVLHPRRLRPRARLPRANGYVADLRSVRVLARVLGRSRVIGAGLVRPPSREGCGPNSGAHPDDRCRSLRRRPSAADSASDGADPASRDPVRRRPSTRPRP